VVNIDGYLDKVCARLRVNPAEAEDLREELRGHIEELIESYSAGGADRAEARELALAWFGEAHKLHDCLDLVHQGDAWWVYRLKGMLLGALFGALLALLIPFGGHIEFLTRLFPMLSHLGNARLDVVINALLVGGLIGLVASGDRSLFVGWLVGSLVWLIEYAAYWIIGVASNTAPPEESLTMLNSVLLSPLLGGLFGAAVGISTAAMLSRLSKARPEIR
jgi:hypothetical protein